MNELNLDTFEEHRPFLLALASRITGSWSDAQDLVTEANLRWHALDQKDIANPKAFLATMVSRLALNQRTSARSRREIVVEPALASDLKDAARVDPEDLADALGGAFKIVLGRMAPTERAVFLLREVFEFSYDELAELLGETEANCRQILKRARDKIILREPRFDVNPRHCEVVLERFLSASRSGNFDQLIAAVAPEVVLMRDASDIGLPQPPAIHGRPALFEHIRLFWQKFMDAVWTCYRIGEGHELALVQTGDTKILGAFICTLDGDGTIKRMDHITCPTRLSVLLQLFRIRL